jgi:hypothetical protein
MTMKYFCLLALVGLGGCAARVAPSSRTTIVMPNACIEKIRQTQRMRCTGPDENHLVCTGIEIQIIKGCAEINVKK